MTSNPLAGVRGHRRHYVAEQFQESLRVRQVKLIPYREGWIWQSRSPAFYEYGHPLPTQDAAWQSAAAVLQQHGIVKWQASEAYWVSREVVAVVEVRKWLAIAYK
ncbi:hypothetical protein H2136_20770 [Aeromonas hydrophila]|uniref:Uncharacterized protein n=1 Tax=Aeromonas hydrophila TaxID=644 RepID=A0A926ITX1_AERHY|nr:hypothetical protein [Aeromonas hydrophila]